MGKHSLHIIKKQKLTKLLARLEKLGCKMKSFAKTINISFEKPDTMSGWDWPL